MTGPAVVEQRDPVGRGRNGSPPGPLLFARYAYAPNRLGYCGPDEVARLHDYASSGTSDAGLRDLAQAFEGAFPYLQLIAAANAIPDPLDRRVVEAYWLGNDLLRPVSVGALHRSLDERFRPRLATNGWRWLERAAPDGAKPVHAFHVLDVLPRVGLLRGGRVDDLLSVIDSCRIRWGTVLAVNGSSLVVSAPRLELVDGRLAIGATRAEAVEGWPPVAGESPISPGEVVSLHWGWACDRLTRRQLTSLERWTAYELEIANRAI